MNFNDLLEIEEQPNGQDEQKNPQHDIKYEYATNNLPWIEKYRPKKLDDIVYQDEIIKMLKKTIKDGNLPHLLLYGPAGTGKTSTVMAIALELFGPKKFKERVIELNASDERGINVVRNKIVTFAKAAIGNPDPNYPCPDYKIIILDEADAMTKEAQAALRKTMEDNSNITRFCFICNYINQIIEPINSRCVKYRFKPLDELSMYTKLVNIAKSENININEDGISGIVEISDGDMRKAIMMLQNIKYIKSHDAKESINKNDVFNMTGFVTEDILNKIKDVCISKTQNVGEIMKLTRKITSYGYPLQSVLNQINIIIIHSKNLTDKMKANISIHLMKTEKRLIEGADEYLQLLSVFMCIKHSIIVNTMPIKLNYFI